jgi:hypothetical protein
VISLSLHSATCPAWGANNIYSDNCHNSIFDLGFMLKQLLAMQGCLACTTIYMPISGICRFMLMHRHASHRALWHIYGEFLVRHQYQLDCLHCRHDEPVSGHADMLQSVEYVHPCFWTYARFMQASTMHASALPKCRWRRIASIRCRCQRSVEIYLPHRVTHW